MTPQRVNCPKIPIMNGYMAGHVNKWKEIYIDGLDRAMQTLSGRSNAWDFMGIDGSDLARQEMRRTIRWWRSIPIQMPHEFTKIP